MKLGPLKNYLNSAIILAKDDRSENDFLVEIKGSQLLANYSSLEISLVLYPYSRKMQAENFHFQPFEDYIKDILDGQKSSYFRISRQFDKVFGLILGIFVVLVFVVFNQTALASVESVAAIVGLYLVGKELWRDIENFLLNLSKNWSARFYPLQYSFERQGRTTINDYSRLARQRKYGLSFLMPNKIDLIHQLNSQTIRMEFLIKEHQALLEENQARVLTIETDPEISKQMEAHNGLFGTKISFNQSFAGIKYCTEIFQSIDGFQNKMPSQGNEQSSGKDGFVEQTPNLRTSYNNQLGCIDSSGEWISKAIFVRKTILIGRLKIYLSKKVFNDMQVLEWR